MALLLTGADAESPIITDVVWTGSEIRLTFDNGDVVEGVISFKKERGADPGEGELDIDLSAEDVERLEQNVVVTKKLRDALHWLIQARNIYFTGDILAVTSDTVLEDGGVTVLVDTSNGDVTITLPPANCTTRELITIKKALGDTGSVIVVPTGPTANTNLIECEVSVSMGDRGRAITLASDGVNYWIISSHDGDITAP